MKTLINKTRGPIKVPLPRGKSLRLGPSNAGQIRDEDVDHPALKKLIEAGDIELVAAGAETSSAIGSTLARPAGGGGPRKAARRLRSGER
jgi:hypothetical protein